MLLILSVLSDAEVSSSMQIRQIALIQTKQNKGLIEFLMHMGMMKTVFSPRA